MSAQLDVRGSSKAVTTPIRLKYVSSYGIPSPWIMQNFLKQGRTDMTTHIAWAADLDEALRRATEERRFILADFSKER